MRRGGASAPWPRAAEPRVDGRDDQEFVYIDGTAFLNGNEKAPELLRALSIDRTLLARVTGAADGYCRLNMYARDRDTWKDFEGPSIMVSLPEARALARQILGYA